MKAKYRFLLIAAKIFKVFGWIALVLGVIFSILMGVGVGVGMGMGTAIPWLGGFGAFYTIFGILYSVIIWVSLLATAEILHLLIDLEQNTRETAELLRNTEKSK